MTIAMKHVGRFTARRRLGRGASCRVELTIADRVIVTTTAIVLIAVSLVLATPAAATTPRGASGPGDHLATSAIREHERVGGSSRRWRRDNVGTVATDHSVDEPRAAAGQRNANLGAWLPGRDKCKRRRGLRMLPLWCTDPAAGWIGSTTYRTQNDPGNPSGISTSATTMLPRSAIRYARPRP